MDAKVQLGFLSVKMTNLSWNIVFSPLPSMIPGEKTGLVPIESRGLKQGLANYGL